MESIIDYRRFIYTDVPERNNGYCIYKHQTQENTILLVGLWTDSCKKGSISTIKDLIAEWSYAYVHVLAIAPSISTPCSLFIDECNAESLVSCYEFIPHKYTQNNWMNSNIVPRYTVLTRDDIVLIEKQLKCTYKNWPIMTKSDPVSIVMGLSVGDCLTYYQGGRMYRCIE